ncbi:MAG: S41 family peptidase [Phycisphaerales bacterium]
MLAPLISGCSMTPKLTAEERKKDIQYLADWARDYCPFVELNEKYKNTPSYEALLPKYLEYAEQAQNNREFLLVLDGYFKVIGASGHYYPIPKSTLKLAKVGMRLGVIDLGVTPDKLDRAVYWAGLYQKISTRAHPPFRIVHRQGRYYTDDDWRSNRTTIPRGSEIIKVDGMTCPSFLKFIKESTFLRYDAYPKGWINQYLLVIDEGDDFMGWHVDFLLPDNSTCRTFVPKIKGPPAPRQEPVQTIERQANCTCLELTENVGYIRIKGCMSGQLSYIFRGFIKKDRNKIKAFLDRSEGKYSKLIIDFRNTNGGLPLYGYDVLISPFLDEPAVYSQAVGLKTKYLTDTDEPILQFLRKDVSDKEAHVTNLTKIQPPEGFSSNEWTFYKVTRRIEPHDRYNFDGHIYVLINGGCFSAADDYPNAVKQIGFATLVGCNTAGGAASYLGSPYIMLPASGMVFRAETELVINPDGSYNELFGTPPDIELEPADLPKSIDKEELLKNEWVKKIIYEL